MNEQGCCTKLENFVQQPCFLFHIEEARIILTFFGTHPSPAPWRIAQV